MYRALTWLALEQGVSLDDPDGLGHLAGAVQLRPVSMQGEAVEVAGTRVGPELRETRVDNNVSNVSQPSPRAGSSGGTATQLRQFRDGPQEWGERLGQRQRNCNDRSRHRHRGTAGCRAQGLPDRVRQGSARPVVVARCGSEERSQTWRPCLRKSRPGTPSIPPVTPSPLRPAADAWQLDTTCLDVHEVVNAILQRVNDDR